MARSILSSTSAALAAAVVAGAVLALPSDALHAQNGERNVWEGVYSEDQAKDGRERYRKACGGCHADDLTGDDGPSLRGGHFASSWENQTVGDLLFTIGTTMPLDSPSSLTPEEYLDIIAFILKENGIPAGAVKLPADPEKLSKMLITVQRPAK